MTLTVYRGPRIGPPEGSVTLGPTAHLSWDELACHDGTPYPLDWRPSRVVTLAREFEAVRAILSDRVGKPVPLDVHSGYRTRAFNLRIEGSPRSQHCEGRALDIAPGDPALLDLLYEVVLQRARAVLALRGIGRYNSFVHMDTRPQARLALWDERTKK